jgi:hypothetical protein
MAVVVLEQMEVLVLHLQAEEVMTTRQQQTEVVEDHNPLQIVGLHLRVVLVL